MEQESSHLVPIFNLKEDKLHLSYPDKLESWKISNSGCDEIISEQLNFRHLGYSASELRNEEENNRFPPRFKLNIVNTNYTPSEISLYEYHIYIKSEGESDKTLTLNICGFGHPNKGIVKPTDLSRALSSACRSVSDAWNLKRLDSINLNGTGTVIAVLDTTIDQHFPSFTGKDISVIDYLPGVPVVSTVHGTICSAVAVGLQDDTTPRGVAPCAKLIVYRIAEGEIASINAIINALDDIRNKLARGEQIDVVSISYDCDENSEDTLDDKIKVLTEMGVTFVAAAGNRGQYQARACIPARFNSVISVGALDRYGNKARFTPSVKIDVYAPGEDIEFPIIDCKFWGTSYAAPAVAGLVLLLKQWANNVGLPAEENINRVEVLREIFKKEMVVKSDSGDDDDVFAPVEFFMRMKDNPKKLNDIVLKYLPSDENKMEQ